jgi:hypothetical protein
VSQASTASAASWVFDDAMVAQRDPTMAATGSFIEQLCRSDLSLLTLEVVLARRAGDSIGAIADSLEVSASTVRRHLLAFVAWLESQDHAAADERIAA